MTACGFRRVSSGCGPAAGDERQSGQPEQSPPAGEGGGGTGEQSGAAAGEEEEEGGWRSLVFNFRFKSAVTGILFDVTLVS